ncbi:MAG: hypothetical protein GY924_16155 [Planctomycetaceae bacterium]|nr:hypothetical protein [Planctomycetaceae bacterium]
MTNQSVNESTRTEGPPTQKAQRKSSDFRGPSGEFAELQSARVGDEGLEEPLQIPKEKRISEIGGAHRAQRILAPPAGADPAGNHEIHSIGGFNQYSPILSGHSRIRGSNLTTPSPQSTSNSPPHSQHWNVSCPIGSLTGTVSTTPQCGHSTSAEPVTATGNLSS